MHLGEVPATVGEAGGGEGGGGGMGKGGMRQVVLASLKPEANPEVSVYLFVYLSE